MDECPHCVGNPNGCIYCGRGQGLMAGCAHENVGVEQVWKDGECVSSTLKCDDCGATL